MLQLLVVSTFLAQTWPPPQMPTEEEFKQVQGMVRSSRLTPSRSPVEVLDTTPPPKTVDAAQQKPSLARFQNAWFLTGRFSERQGFEVDAFHLPNPGLCKVSVSWVSARAKDGRALLSAPTAKETLNLGVPSGQITLNTGDEAIEVVEAKAKATIELATDFEELVLPCSEASKKLATGSLSATMVACRQDIFTIRAENPPDDVLVRPLNAAKKPLSVQESSHEPLFAGDKRLDAISYEDFKKGPGSTWIFEGRAKGKVAFVSLVRAKPSKPIELDIVATPEPKMENYAANARPRYLSPHTPVPNYTAFGKRKPTLAFKSGRSCAMFGYNAPQIHLTMPAVDNSRLAKVELAPPKVVGGRGEHQLVENGYDAPTHTYRWTLEGQDSNTPLKFGRVEVKAQVRYPLTVESFGYPVPSQKPALFAGNKVQLPFAGESGEIVDVTAYDSSGMPLKRFGYSESDGETSTYYFMGTATRVIGYVARDWVDLQVAGKLTPAAMRPANRAGLCD